MVMAGSISLHTPPAALSLRVVVPSTHTCSKPVTADGVVLTLTVVMALQPAVVV